MEKNPRPTQSIEGKGFSLSLSKPVVMGIINLTPDSFYDAGKYFSPEKAILRAKEMEKEGADIIDVGAESTKPGAAPVSREEEIERLVPVISELSQKLKIPVSCDTYKGEVAEKAIEAGAGIINDIYALRYDETMVRVVKNAGCPVILMHMKGTPETMQKNPSYDNVIKEIYDFLKERISFAESSGIKENKIIIDPGIGFGKKVEDNIEILKKSATFRRS